MKRRLLLFLTMCICMVSGAWAQDPYEISNAQDLIDFAEAVNSGETTAKAVLTANIDLKGYDWTPIGNADNIFTGTFDGQGYAITNFSYTATSDYNGLFGFIKDATVKNFSISGSLTSDGFTKNGVIGNANGKSKVSGIHSSLNITIANKNAHSGGIVGGDDGTVSDVVLVENCEYSGTMTHTGQGDCQAGILGYTGYGGVKNCIFSGTIIGESSKYGGILGYTRRNTFVGVQNCLSIGKIVATEGCTTAAAIIANYNGSATSNVKNNYYCLAEGSTTTISIGNKASSCEEPVKVTAEELASGKVCYQLNGNQSEDVAFYQNLPAASGDNIPVLDKTHGVVYAIGSFRCDGKTPKGDITYSNTETSPSVDDHTPVDGFCSFCGVFDPDFFEPVEGYYQIANGTQLKWFATYVNTVSAKANGKLTADINLTGVTWTPIGFGVNYTGTFDGQGFSISNFYLSTTANSSGLFGQVSGGAVIKNFTVEGEIVSNGHQYVGGVVGNATVASTTITISNVHSIVNIACTVSRHGGILGAQTAANTVNIDRCTYSGTFDAKTTSGNYGGFIGLTNNNASAYVNITNCLFDGTIKNVGGDAGGFVGFTNGTKVTFKNCLSNGTFIDTTTPGQFFGTLKANNSSWAGKNYYVEGNVKGTGAGNPSGDVPEAVTTAQLESGYVAAKLAPAFRQVLGTDTYPSPDATKPLIAEITSAGYATLFVPETSLEIPTGVTAYTGTIDGEWLKLNPLENVITNGQAVVLKGDAGYYSFIPTDAGFGLIKSDLVGADTDITADGTQYILAQPEGEKVGFYKAKDATTIKAGKAYLKVPAAGVKGFILAEEDATAIANVNVNDNQTPVYNLAGQRISKMQKGINIVNGKKVLK